MHVKRLEILNLRSFRSVDIKLSRHINLIAGGNNAGKSTLLKTIYLLQERYTFKEHDRRLQTTRSDVRITLDQVMVKQNGPFENLSSVKAEDEQICEILFPLSSPSYDAYYSPGENTLHPTLQEVSRQQLRLTYRHTFQYFSNEENKGNFIYPFFARRRTGFVSQGGKNESFHVYDDFHNLPSKVQKVANRPITKKKFHDLCKDILGFEVSVYQDEHGQNRIGLELGYNDRIPLESMGEGTANILGLITLLLTENNKVFLLEELENDIHPEALKKLLKLIIEKSKTNQFVISTHSHIILKYLGAVPETKLFFSEWTFDQQNDDPPQSSVSEIGCSPRERLEILERLGYELYDIDMYSAYLIFEESSAEKLIREYLIPEFVPELQNSLRTIASQGVNDVPNKFHGLNSLFMYLHLNEVYRNRAWVLVDGDEAGKKIIERLRKNYADWDSSHFDCLSKPDIETYYPSQFTDRTISVLQMNKGLARQEAKQELLTKVLEWSQQSPQEARKAFYHSAGEIIGKLKTIAAQLHLS